MSRRPNSRRKQAGFILTIELLLLATICVIGLIVGMTNVRDSVLAELSDVSESVGSLNQGYNVTSVANAAGTAATAGSAFSDAKDTNGLLPIDSGVGNSAAELTFVPAVPNLGENIAVALP
ncbi:MAG: hypothetical protein JO093_24530 [Acidobacteria bacterium]|nr:hypothetical protein [Acidobacteriota bacterium]MBV9071858.1 hypothetical protein [Acidobacteriota bacterium]MBV9188796.1 hypothetical protein [Acidobacteriota bacterium]